VALGKRQHKFSKLQGYGVALGVFLIALALRFVLFPVEIGLAFLTFYPAMVLTFALCGIGPGVFLTVLSSVTCFFIFFPPYYSFEHNPVGEIAVITFLFSAYLIAKVIGQLRDTTFYLRDLINNSPAGIITIDPRSGKLTSANPVALKLWGYCEEELYTKSIDDLTPADEWEVSRKRNEALFSGEVDSLHFEKRYLRKDGSIFWAETYASTLKDARGNIRLFIGYTTDIKDRKRLEIEINELNRDFVIFLENTSDFIYFKDQNSRFIFCSQTLAKITGHNSWRDMIGKHDQEVFPEDVAQIYSKEEFPIFRDGVPLLNKINPYYDASGNKGWVSTNKWPIFNEIAQVVGVFGISHDITQFKNTQDALKVSEDKYRALLEDQTELICRFHADGLILYVNDAYCRYFGVSKDSVVGSHWQPVVYEADLPHIQAQLAALTPANDVVTTEIRVFVKGNEIRWGQFINRGFFDQQGNLIEIQAVGRDITDRKRAEEKASQFFDLLTKIANRVPGVVYQLKLRPDGSFCFPFASEAIREIYRVTPEQVREDASAVFANIHPDDLDGINRSINASADTLTLWHYEYRVKFKDGIIRWLLGNAMPNRDEDGSTTWHGFITDITDQKKLELVLQTESEKNLALLRNASDGIHILDQSGSIIEVSDSFCMMLGYTREELLGMHVSSWDAEISSVEQLMAALKQQLDNPNRSLFETRHRRKDGSIFDVEVSGQALILSGKQVLFNSSRDISERKQTAAMLAKSTKEIEDLYDNAPCGYHSVDQNGKFLFINATELAWLGCAKEDVIGKKKPSDFFSPEGRVLYEKSFPDFLKNGYLKELEFELVGRDSSRRVVSLNATTILDENGKYLMSRSVLFDITRIKEIQEALRISEERFRIMANSAPVLIWIAGLDKACHWFNKVWLDFTGRTLEQEMGNGWAEGVHPDDFDRCFEVYSSHIDRREEFRMEYRLRRHDGVYRWIDDHGVPLFDSKGNFSGYIGSCIDVSDSKQASLQLQNALQNLESQTARLETILKNASDGIHIMDTGGNLLQFSETFARMLGYTYEETSQLNVADWEVNFSKEQLDDVFKKLLTTTSKFETKHRRKDGSVFDVEINATEVILDGKSCLYASSRDITERKEHEQKLKQLSIEQQAMLDNELIGIIKLRNRQILWHNKAINRIFGYESDELIGISTRILYPDILAYEELGNAAYTVLNKNGLYRTQMEMVRKNGEIIWIDLNGALLSDQSLESIWMMADITQLKQHEAEMAIIAYHDILTGLPNRLLVFDLLKQLLAQAERANRKLAVCYLDLDGFKPINDNYGHNAGDQLLKEIANRMQASVRANDTVGRLGGDEFVLLLTDLETIDEYQVVVDRLTNAINQPIYLSEAVQVKIGVSIGITLFPNDGDDPDILLRQADQAMYQAKQSGRNRVCLFTPDKK
jgi:diguanylate cyclase (GGDEF)-like protein/PAS domain S-box-containing protein